MTGREAKPSFTIATEMRKAPVRTGAFLSFADSEKALDHHRRPGRGASGGPRTGRPVRNDMGQKWQVDPQQNTPNRPR
jgi:hypothetical protein